MNRQVTSGSAAYQLSDDERAVIHTPTGKRFNLRGKKLDVYRALSYARGRYLTTADLQMIVWRKRPVSKDTVQMTISNLREQVGPEVVETCWNFGYRVGRRTSRDGVL